jgi:hypothetical protein
LLDKKNKSLFGKLNIMNSKLMTFNRLALKLAALALIASCISGRMLALEAVDVGDAYTQAGAGNSNAGNAATMLVSGSGSNLRRGWIQFDVNSVLPAQTTGSQIAKATLKLWSTTVATSGTVNVFAVVGAPWAEATITHNNAPLVSATIENSFAVTTVGSFVTVDLTPLVVDWVNGPLNGGMNNYGIVLVPAASTVNVSFDAMESTATSHGPQLDIVLNSLTTGTIPASQVSGLTFASLSSKPITLAGYGITDPILLSTGSYSSPTWLSSFPYSKITGAPTNVSSFTNDAGYIVAGGAVSSLTITGTANITGMLLGTGPINTLPNQTLTGGSTSILTQGLADKRYVSGSNIIISSAPSVAFTGGSASGYTALAGFYGTASGAGSIALGIYSIASASCSFATGIASIGSGANSIAMGYFSSASGLGAVAIGYDSGASGQYSTAAGLFTTASGYDQFVIGQYNIPQGSSTTWVPTDELFTIGNGTSASSKSDAFLVKKNGDTTVSGALIVSSTTGSTSMISGALNVSGTTKHTNSVIFSGSAVVLSGGTTYVALPNQAVLIPQQGDLSMGTFINGKQPQ